MFLAKKERAIKRIRNGKDHKRDRKKHNNITNS